MDSSAKRVAVTHASGEIAQALLAAIARGELLGPDRPVALVLLDDGLRLRQLRSLATRLSTVGVNTLKSVEIAIDPHTAFRDADYVILLDPPRKSAAQKPGLLNLDILLLRAFGQALNAGARRDVKVTVAGDDANIRAWILRCFTPDLPSDAITATVRADYDDILHRLASLCDANPYAIDRLIVWGKQRYPLYPDFRFARIGRRPVPTLVAARGYDRAIVHSHLVRPSVTEGVGTCAIQASTHARGIISHFRDWIEGTNGKWVSMIVPSDGSHDIPKGLMFSMPVICKNGTFEYVRSIDIDNFSKRHLSESVDAVLADVFAFRREFVYRGPIGF
ncbi:malate dehydrogenase [Burkholderia sp. Nafp2/4-1b]|uniref:lactate/malate family dehydrogenase n=1 Tax=Burkholderia sp. Nafp2/4-1b TaxID=2116686 RepID=UPI000EF8A317|nr:malate dehydrogenase [Burkholderia sp. Nafp2/4-1b]RKT98682.1 malate dehydrogenase [Burkholderia sp. Nafp2/4-1b]